MNLRFFKQDGRWYADIPNHTLEENEMVAGSEDLLELLSEGKKSISLTLTTEQCNEALIELTMCEHDSCGATYKLNEPYGEITRIWICNVTHDVLGEHPHKIWICSYK